MDNQSPSINLKKQVLSGTFWSAGGQVATATLRFGIMLVLARLLSVEFFGLLGMSLVVMLILRDVSDIGLGAALVQREAIDETDLATIFWLNLGVSLLMAGVLFAGAGFLAQMLGDGRMESILKVLAFLLPVNALTVVPQAVMRRELKFTQLSWRNIAGELGFGLAGIPMALLGMGVWSLVGALSAQWIFRAGLLWVTSPYRPTLRFSWSRLRTMSEFSIWMFVGMLIGRVMANIDYFLIGRFLGASALGYYTLAFQLVIVPNQRITGILSWVLFPSFSKIQSQAMRLHRGLLKVLKHLAVLVVPISAFLFTSAEALVPFLYSSKWLPAVPVVRLLSLASFFYGLDIMNSLLNAIGRPNWRVWILGVRASSFVLLAWAFGLARGIEGVAFSILMAVAISSMLQIWVLGRELKISSAALWRSVNVSLLSIIPVSFIGWGLITVMVNQPDGIKVVALAAAMGLGYAALILPSYYKELRELVQVIGLDKFVLVIKYGRAKS